MERFTVFKKVSENKKLFDKFRMMLLFISSFFSQLLLLLLLLLSLSLIQIRKNPFHNNSRRAVASRSCFSSHISILICLCPILCHNFQCGNNSKSYRHRKIESNFSCSCSCSCPKTVFGLHFNSNAILHIRIFLKGKISNSKT